jgi:hypothetical protein
MLSTATCHLSSGHISFRGARPLHLLLARQGRSPAQQQAFVVCTRRFLLQYMDPRKEALELLAQCALWTALRMILWADCPFVLCHCLKKLNKANQDERDYSCLLTFDTDWIIEIVSSVSLFFRVFPGFFTGAGSRIPSSVGRRPSAVLDQFEHWWPGNRMLQPLSE